MKKEYKVLFILKKRQTSHTGYASVSSGLFNSARFVSDMLNKNGIEKPIVKILYHSEYENSSAYQKNYLEFRYLGGENWHEKSAKILDLMDYKSDDELAKPKYIYTFIVGIIAYLVNIQSSICKNITHNILIN